MSTTSDAPHHVSDWIAHWTAPVLLTVDDAVNRLMWLHAGLLGEAENGSGRDVYLYAAGLVNRTLLATNKRSVRQTREQEPVLAAISEFIEELIRVLQDQNYDASRSALSEVFGLASGRVDHVFHQARIASDGSRP